MRNPAQIAVGEGGFLPPRAMWMSGGCAGRARRSGILGVVHVGQDTESKEGVGPVLDVGKSLAFVERRKD